MKAGDRIKFYNCGGIIQDIDYDTFEVIVDCYEPVGNSFVPIPEKWIPAAKPESELTEKFYRFVDILTSPETSENDIALLFKKIRTDKDYLDQFIRPKMPEVNIKTRRSFIKTKVMRISYKALEEFMKHTGQIISEEAT